MGWGGGGVQRGVCVWEVQGCGVGGGCRGVVWGEGAEVCVWEVQVCVCVWWCVCVSVSGGVCRGWGISGNFPLL